MELDNLIETSAILLQEKRVRQARVTEYVQKAYVETQCIAHLDSQIGDVNARIGQLQQEQADQPASEETPVVNG